MALGPLPAVASVLRVRIVGTTQGHPWVALHYWHYNAPAVNTGDVNSIMAQWKTAYTTHIAPTMRNTVVANSFEAFDLSAPTGAFGQSPGPVPGTRGALGSLLPVSVCAVTSWKVNYRWRGGHARTYWPAGDSSDVTGGNLWTDQAASAFDTANDNYLAAVNGITVGGVGGHMTLVRYVHTVYEPDKHVEYFDPPLDLPIMGASVDKRIDTQRRRLGKDL